ncbi:GNAT family N-acetyltransferase [Permianibacter sp. IMCC34836]|uniref:GNAT family N-acetyltransferase n=1 Tax=Permianibacter fluminis TaxID=2738515 RepID=UPI0015530BC3|nr:GNAT family N-acetyltransferase [Permianibacter fluminis]NQD35775.1 GNAT family N-acetyltransferase [Permianibacter fluminis]
MLNRLRFWREKNWQVIDADTYAATWQRFGGSLLTQPDVVARLSALAETDVRYLGWQDNGEWVAAIPTWGRYLALSRQALKRMGKPGLFDLGNAEIILPMAADAHIQLRHSCKYLTATQAEQIAGARKQKEELTLAKDPDDMVRKVRYNLRRELRLLEEAGGVIRPMHELTAAEQAKSYIELFERRWGFAAAGRERLAEVLALLREFVVGSVVYLHETPIAIQLLYRVESPQWISVEYVNGGVDPQTRDFSPGSVLTYLNTQAAWADAKALGKTLRYSFGRADREYKDRWCNRVPVYQV